MDNIIADYEREFSDEYEIEIRNGKSSKDIEDAFVEGDAVIVVGHGTHGLVSSQTKGDPFNEKSLDKVIRRRKGKKLKFVHVVSCKTLSQKSMNKKWQKASKSTAGGKGQCNVAKYQHGLLDFEVKLGG